VNDTNYTGTGNTSYNSHVVFANLTGYVSNWTSVNFTGRDYTANITLYSTSTSSCTYAGSGNWIINTADRCNITASQYLGTNTLTLNGSVGYVTFGTPTGTTLILTALKLYWNITGTAYMWFKNSTWINGTM